MRCPTCQTGETTPGTATKTLERGATLVVVRHVPAEVCDRCGAPLYAGAVVDRLLLLLEAAHHGGVTFEVREFPSVSDEPAEDSERTTQVGS
jgi:YgiT-type zinc finger domain-containing protein